MLKKLYTVLLLIPAILISSEVESPFELIGWQLHEYDIPQLEKAIEKAPEYDVNFLIFSHDLFRDKEFGMKNPILVPAVYKKYGDSFNVPDKVLDAVENFKKEHKLMPCASLKVFIDDIEKKKIDGRILYEIKVESANEEYMLLISEEGMIKEKEKL